MISISSKENSLFEAMNIIYENMVNDADSSTYGRILSITSNEYSVDVEGVTYKIKSQFDFTINERVLVLSPSGGTEKYLYPNKMGTSGGTGSVLTTDTRFKGLRLAKRVIVEATTPLIEIDTDSDGNALNSTLGGELLCYSGENVSITTALGYLQINGITTSEYWGTVLEPTESLAFGLWGNVSTEVFSKIRLLNKNVTIDVQSTARYEYGGGMKRHGGGMTTPQTAVTAIKLFLSTGEFPTGTIVEWWEMG